MKHLPKSIYGILLLLFTIVGGGQSCDSKFKNSINENVVNNLPSPSQTQVQKESVPSTIKQDWFIIIHFPNEPVALLDLKLTNADRPANARLSLQSQNVSNKNIKLVMYGLSVSYRCSEYMYKAILTPYIGYGDWSLIGSREEKHPPTLKPNEKVTIELSKDEQLKKFLEPKTYRSCPDGYKKPELSLIRVYFEDGTVWKSSEQEPIENP